MPDLGQRADIFDTPGIYRICVGGYLDASWSDSLGSMTISVGEVTDEECTTSLTGMVADQAALAGILRTIHELRLPLLSVIRIQDP